MIGLEICESCEALLASENNTPLKSSIIEYFRDDFEPENWEGLGNSLRGLLRPSEVSQDTVVLLVSS